MTMHTVTFELGKAADLYKIFAFSPALAAKKTPAVMQDAIEHAINQTMLRDGYYGAWANVSSGSYWRWKDDDVYKVRITSPSQPVDAYAETYPKFLAAVAHAHRIWEQCQDAITAQQEKLFKQYAKQYPDRHYEMSEFAVEFLPPFGLAMAESNAIQLLHYPPAETLTYMDYLYSPTNRRWENLLGFNGYPGPKNTLVETIVDIGPMAANGGALGSDVISTVLPEFREYALEMLRALLRTSPSGDTTTPIVAYGGPVGRWLMAVFGTEIKRQGVKIEGRGKGSHPAIAEAFTLKIYGKDGPATPVMTANHPIKFNYYDKDFEKAQHYKDAKKAIGEVDRKSAIVLSQDLIAAGWQAAMAQSWGADPDPTKVRKAQFKKWGDHKAPHFQEIFKVFKEQVIEFSIHFLPQVETKAWEEQLKKAVEG